MAAALSLDLRERVQEHGAAVVLSRLSGFFRCHGMTRKQGLLRPRVA